MTPGTSASYTNLAVKTSDAGTYDVVVSNRLGTSTSAPIRVTVVVRPGSVIRSFANAQLGLGVGELAVLPDGRFLAGSLSGGLRAFLPTGTPDPAFTVVGGFNTDFSERVAVDASRQRVLVSPATTLRAYDFQGAVLPTFTAPPAAPRWVRVETDGSLLVGDNSFSSFFQRLDLAGAIVPSFQPALLPAIDAQPLPDGRLLVLSSSQSIIGGGLAYPTRIARLLHDGGLDPTFAVSSNTFPLGKRALHLTPDHLGRVLVFGEFETYANQPRSHLARLLDDGTLDPDFTPPTIDGEITDLVEQSNGRLVLVGGFTHVGGLSRSLIARLNPDGSHDATFDPGAGLTRGFGQNIAFDVELLPAGQILVAGTFDHADGQLRQGLALLTGDPLGPEQPADLFTPWAAQAGLAGADAQLDADPDHDGASNAAEFAYGTSPTNPASRPSFNVSLVQDHAAEYPAVTLIRRQSIGSLALSIQVADTLAFTTDLGATVVPQRQLADGLEEVVIRSNARADSRPVQFFRFTLHP